MVRIASNCVQLPGWPMKECVVARAPHRRVTGSRCAASPVDRMVGSRLAVLNGRISFVCKSWSTAGLESKH